MTSESYERFRQIIDMNDYESLVVGFEHHIPTLSQPGADDRRVLAAGIVGPHSCRISFRTTFIQGRMCREDYYFDVESTAEISNFERVERF